MRALVVTLMFVLWLPLHFVCCGDCESLCVPWWPWHHYVWHQHQYVCFGNLDIVKFVLVTLALHCVFWWPWCIMLFGDLDLVCFGDLDILCFGDLDILYVLLTLTVCALETLTYYVLVIVTYCMLLGPWHCVLLWCWHPIMCVGDLDITMLCTFHAHPLVRWHHTVCVVDLDIILCVLLTLPLYCVC